VDSIPETDVATTTTSNSTTSSILLSEEAIKNYLSAMKKLLQEMGAMVAAVLAFELHTRSLKQEIQKKVNTLISIVYPLYISFVYI
jgi:hypothetical protein